MGEFNDALKRATLKLPKAHSVKSCPKCGTKYYGPRLHREPRCEYRGTEQVQEFLTRTCTRCGYQWDEQCLSQEELSG